MMRAQPWKLCLLIGSLTALVGCGGGFEYGVVEGKLLVEGSPVDKIQVEFFPTKEGPRSMGVTDAEGRFSLTTDDGKPGAVVGTHKIVLRDVGIMGAKFMGRAAEDVDMTEGRTPRITNDYVDPTKTPLQKEVTAGKSVISLEAKAPPKQSGGKAK